MKLLRNGSVGFASTGASGTVSVPVRMSIRPVGLDGEGEIVIAGRFDPVGLDHVGAIARGLRLQDLADRIDFDFSFRTGRFSR